MTTTVKHGTLLRTLRGWPLFIVFSLLFHLLLLLSWYLFYPEQPTTGDLPPAPLAVHLEPAAPQPPKEPAAVEPPRTEPPATKKAPAPQAKPKVAEETVARPARQEPANSPQQPPAEIPERYRNMGTSQRLLDTFPDAGGAVAPAPAVEPAPAKITPDEESRLQIELLIRTRFAEHFNYPRMAQSHGWQGEVLLSFLIGLDGTLTHIQVVRSSGHAILDQAALESMRNIKRIEFAPGMVLHHELELHMPVIYRLAQR